MHFRDRRWFSETTTKAAMLVCFIVFGIDRPRSQAKKIGEVDCSGDPAACGQHGRCVNVEPDRWNSVNSSKCRCNHNWHGDHCSVCMGRFLFNSEDGTITDGSGNYSSNTNCTWLLNPERHAKSKLKLSVVGFSTECGWDHLYIHDGSSFDAPLVAVLSGYVPDPRSYAWSSLALSTGSGFFYFTSDSEFNMPGFEIEYSYDTCPEGCSGNGFCDEEEGRCECHPGWIGPSCSAPLCPGNCSHPQGTCLRDGCSCSRGYKGEDCSRLAANGYWEVVKGLDVASDDPPPTASHGSVVVGDFLYVIGGYSFAPNSYLRVFRSNLRLGGVDFEELLTSNPPQPRYGHAVAAHQDGMYVSGGATDEGVASDELWFLSRATHDWAEATSFDGSRMVAVSGHTMHVIGGTVYILFGHSPTLGYLNFVQTFDLGRREWGVVRARGTSVIGLYGHSSVYDESRSRILVHGGFSSRLNLCSLKDDVLSFDLPSRTWKYLRGSGHVKYLHSAVLHDDLIFVFGGNTHNDTAVSHGAHCFSSKFLIYDVECDVWHSINEPKFGYNAARYGHSSVMFDGDVYLHGGFNGMLYNDLFKFVPGKCDESLAEAECLRRQRGSRCAFVVGRGCMPLERARALKLDEGFGGVILEHTCPNSTEHDHCKDSKLNSCSKCVGKGCVWCADICQSKRVMCSSGEGATEEEQCGRRTSSSSSNHCFNLHNCHACMQDDRCYWNDKSSKSKCEDADQRDSAADNATCGSTCSEQTTCENCTAASCMWCLNRGQCIDSNSYVTSFPYGICHEWTIEPHKCQAKSCGYFRSCRSCLQNPSCGFCNVRGDTGGGQCTEGRLTGPLNPSLCPSSLWSFADCPMCQCNGHSSCHPNTDVCIKCQNFTEGQNCERCMRGYWKDPINDSACVRCECGERADSCDPETGMCLCRLRGAAGKKCDECDMFHKSIDGSCFYELSLNYMLTFNLSKSDSQHHTEMYMFVSASPEKDVELNLNCSSPANLTVLLRKGSEDIVVVDNLLYESYSRRFSVLDLKTQGDKINSTILLYVRHFAYPFVVQVSFSQADQLGLFKFFITFFSCFFSLLLIAFLAWKFKQKYDMYRRTQRHLKEMAEMASRPCGRCLLIVDHDVDTSPPVLNLPPYGKNSLKITVQHKQKRVVPVALEPLSIQKAAVLSVVVRLPHADEPCTLPDQSGLAIASTLVSFAGGRRGGSDPSLKVNKLKSLGDYGSAPRQV